MVNRTENIQKVKRSLRNITSNDITINNRNDEVLEIVGDISILSTIHRFIKSNDLEEVTRNIISHYVNDESIIFYVNKQGAYNNYFNIVDESLSSLGDIEVEIKTTDIDYVLDYLIN
ncbi:MAG: hypothetical protein LUG89_02190 [Methanosphaera sp.]|nr:hypothetical protein [Methanosphaera sp.]